MGGSALSMCPSCGYVGVDDDQPEPHRVRATPACYAAFGELTGGHTLLAHSEYFIHQVALDAYQAQHCPRGARRPLVFSLAGLYLVIEEGRTGRQVQRVHQELARTRHPLPALEPVDASAAGTVAEALARISCDGVVAAVQDWAGHVWNAYTTSHSEVERWVAGWPEPVVAAAGR